MSSDLSSISTVKLEEFSYPPNTPGFASLKGNYLHKLSEENKHKLEQFRNLIISDNIDFKKVAPHALHDDLSCLRYLRANNFNITNALQQLKSTATWRETFEVEKISNLKPEEVLNCPMEQVVRNFSHWQYGYDLAGRPVVYQQYGKFDFAELKKLIGGSDDNLVKYHVWEQEVYAKLCLRKSLETKNIVETVTVIIDLKDVGSKVGTSDFFGLLRKFSDIDQKYYCESLGRAYFINTPWFFAWVWSMISGWLDVATREKIQLLKGPEDYKPKLIELIGLENLPLQYGGQGRELSEEMAPYEEYLQLNL